MHEISTSVFTTDISIFYFRAITKYWRFARSLAQIRYIALYFVYKHSIVSRDNLLKIKRTFENKHMPNIGNNTICHHFDFIRYTLLPLAFEIHKLDEKGKDQEPIQSNSTSCPRHQMGNEFIQFRRHKIRSARADLYTTR